MAELRRILLDRVLLLVVPAILLAACASAPPSTVTVLDGDTIDVVVGGTVERVRLIGINAPESGECFSDEATTALASLVEGRALRLEVDTSDRDAYGRLLRYVWADGADGADGAGRGERETSVNERLVRDGFAIARRYEPDTALSDRLDAAQAEARRSGLGLWAPDACSGDGYGAVSDTDRAGLSIVALQYDAPGDDNRNLNGEWVRIANTGPKPVDLTGWTLKDESSLHRFSFPVGFTLDPQGEVTIHSGCAGDPMEGPHPGGTGAILHWCAKGSAIWNNDGDTAFLLDPAGNIVTTFGY
jgi:micrococcal nuclease